MRQAVLRHLQRNRGPQVLRVLSPQEHPHRHRRHAVCRGPRRQQGGTCLSAERARVVLSLYLRLPPSHPAPQHATLLSVCQNIQVRISHDGDVLITTSLEGSPPKASIDVPMPFLPLVAFELGIAVDDLQVNSSWFSGGSVAGDVTATFGLSVASVISFNLANIHLTSFTGVCKGRGVEIVAVGGTVTNSSTPCKQACWADSQVTVRACDWIACRRLHSCGHCQHCGLLLLLSHLQKVRLTTTRTPAHLSLA